MDSSAETDCGAHEKCDSDSSVDSMENIFPDLSLVLFGNSSAVQFGHANILLGQQQMNVENAEISRIVPLEKKISEHNVSVINMIDLHENEHLDHLIVQLVNENEIHAFIFVVRLGQLTDADKMGLEWLQRVFGEKVLQFVIILFTYEKEEESDTIIDDLKKNPVLEKLLEKCGGGFQTCNKMMDNQSEMRDLMNKIDHLLAHNTASIKRKELKNSAYESKMNFILLGNKGAGKSASGNTILGRDTFISKKSLKPVTRDVAVESGSVDGFPVTVYDTPDFFQTEMSENEIQRMINEKVFQKCESGLCGFLLVIKADSLIGEERGNVEKIEKLLGEKRLKKTWILFTRGDELVDGNLTIEEFTNETDELKTLVEKYEGRVHVFNNKLSGSSDQARLLLVNILQTSEGVKHGGRLTRCIPDSRANADEPKDVPDTLVSSLLSRRIVLLGKTGFGKSASGNTILGQKEFISEISSESVTRGCSEKHGNVSGRSVSVVDTPGFFDTKMKQKHLMREIARSVYLSSPGPHAFLIALRANDRFTEQEQQIPQLIEILFGPEVLKYSIILFTHGDLLKSKSIEEIIKENCRLRHLVDKCGGRFHIFNNEDVNNREQVDDLLQKIDTMLEQNGGGYYSNQIFEDAHRFRQEEEERRKREEEQRKPPEKQRQETERVRKEEVEESEAHKKSKIKNENPEFQRFFRKHRLYWHMAVFALHVTSGELIGALVGGALGLIGGPAGAGIGVAVGAGIGAAVGAFISKFRLSK